MIFDVTDVKALSYSYIVFEEKPFITDNGEFEADDIKAALLFVYDGKIYNRIYSYNGKIYFE